MVRDFTNLEDEYGHRRKELDEWIRWTLKNAKSNARKKNLPFELGEWELRKILQRCHRRCEVSGIKFSFKYPKRSGGRVTRRPWAPSLDRKDSEKGYTFKNCRLVCVAANYAMNHWGEEVLFELSEAVVSKRNGHKNGHKGTRSRQNEDFRYIAND